MSSNSITALAVPKTSVPLIPITRPQPDPKFYPSLKELVLTLFSSSQSDDAILKPLEPFTVKKRHSSPPQKHLEGNSISEPDSIGSKLAALAETSTLSDDELFIFLNHVTASIPDHAHRDDLVKKLWTNTFNQDKKSLFRITRGDYIAFKTLTLLIKDALKNGNADLSPCYRLLGLLDGAGALNNKDVDKWIRTAFTSILRELNETEASDLCNAVNNQLEPTGRLPLVFHTLLKDYSSVADCIDKVRSSNIGSIKQALAKLEQLDFGATYLWEMLFEIVDKCKTSAIKRCVAAKWLEKGEKYPSCCHSFSSWKHCLHYLGEAAAASATPTDFRKIYLGEPFRSTLRALARKRDDDLIEKLNIKCFTLAAKGKNIGGLLSRLVDVYSEFPSTATDLKFFEELVPKLRRVLNTPEGLINAFLIIDSFSSVKSNAIIDAFFLECYRKLLSYEEYAFRTVWTFIEPYLDQAITRNRFPSMEFAGLAYQTDSANHAFYALGALNLEFEKVMKDFQSMKQSRIEAFLRQYAALVERILVNSAGHIYRHYCDNDLPKVIRFFKQQNVSVISIYRAICIKEFVLAKAYTIQIIPEKVDRYWQELSDDPEAADQVANAGIDWLLEPTLLDTAETEPLIEKVMALLQLVMPKVLVKFDKSGASLPELPQLKSMIDKLGARLNKENPVSWIYAGAMLSLAIHKDFAPICKKYDYCGIFIYDWIRLANQKFRQTTPAQNRNKSVFCKKLHSFLFTESSVEMLDPLNQLHPFAEELEKFAAQSIERLEAAINTSLASRNDSDPIAIGALSTVKDVLSDLSSICSRLWELKHTKREIKEKAWQTMFDAMIAFTNKVFGNYKDDLSDLYPFIQTTFRRLATCIDTTVKLEYADALCTIQFEDIDRDEIMKSYRLFEPSIERLLALNANHREAFKLTVDTLLLMSLAFIRYHVSDQKDKQTLATKLLEVLVSRYEELKGNGEYLKVAFLLAQASQSCGVEEKFQWNEGPKLSNFHYLGLLKNDGTKLVTAKKPVNTIPSNQAAFTFLTDYAVKQKGRGEVFLFVANLILKHRKVIIGQTFSTSQMLEFLTTLLDNSNDISLTHTLALFESFYKIIHKPIDKYLQLKVGEAKKSLAALKLVERETKLVFITGSAKPDAHFRLFKFLGRTVRSALMQYRRFQPGAEQEVFRNKLFCFVNLCVKHNLPRTMEEISVIEENNIVMIPLREELNTLFGEKYKMTTENLIRLMLQ